MTKATLPRWSFVKQLTRPVCALSHDSARVTNFPDAVRRLLTWGLPAVLCAALLAPASASAFDLTQELANFSKITERERYVTLTPDFLSLLLTQTATAPLETLNQLATDPERLPANVCGVRGFECAGDVRFYDWAKRTGGVQQPVVFTGRDGATLSGT